MLGIIMMMENKTEQAIPFLRKAIQLRSEEKPELLYNLTLAYVNMKQIDSATDTFLHLQKAAPDHRNIDQLGQRIAELNDEM